MTIPVTTPQTKAPDPPIVVIRNPDGSWNIGGKALTAEEGNALLAYADAANLIMMAPGGSFQALFLSCKGMVASAVRADSMGVVTLFGRVFTSVCGILGLQNAPKIDKSGASTKVGCVAAIRATATTLTEFPAETSNTNVTAASLTQQANYLDPSWSLYTILKAGIEKIDRNTIPVAKSAVDAMRSVLVVVDPILDTHSDMVLALYNALRYLKDPHSKAVKSRKANQRKTDKAVNAATAQVLPQARDQARTEIKQELSDHLAGILGPETTK
jgi:hypothetical protein